MLAQEKKIKGFNIIELLVVLAIIGIIGGLGVPGIMKWVKTRAVANTAEKITSMMSNMSTQLQRGSFAFMQLYMKTDEESIEFFTKGMGINSFTDARNGENAQNFILMNNPDNRCSAPDSPLDDDGDYWDNTKVSYVKLDVFDEKVTTDFFDTTEKDGSVCFNRDGTFYSNQGFMEDTNNMMIYVCELNDANMCMIDFSGDPVSEEFGKNLYRISWSIFGNVKKEKWMSSDWVQK